MKQSNKEGIYVLSLLIIGSFCVTTIADYFYSQIKSNKRKPKSASQEEELKPLGLVSHRRSTMATDKVRNYGSLKIVDIKEDPVLFQLQKMSSLINEVERVNNLIVDLGLEDVKMHPNPIVAHKPKLVRSDPFMSPDALTSPLSFVLHTTEVKSAQMISFTKKWLRAGPRATIYFQSQEVRAGIVSMGGMVPGVNTLIKQLVYALQEYYGVKSITGIKYSFQTNRRQSIDLNIERVKTLHHYGGSLLGVCRTDVTPAEIADRLQSSGINQLYLIGGPGTLHLANELHQEIKNRKLNICFCVIPKEITNSIPITERSIGFETALEETQKIVEIGYTQSHAHENGVSIVKVAGIDSGFLAVETALASRNIQACLVPEFPFELYGEKGLLKFISTQLQTRFNCTIIVAQGCNESILDYDPPIVSHDWDGSPIKEDINMIIKSQLKRYLGQRGVRTTVKTIDTYQTRAYPSNAQQTRICCRYAAQSIHGMMCGYTNFMIGSITGRTVMIPITEVISGNYSDRLIQNSSQWARLLLTTSQPSFLNS